VVHKKAVIYPLTTIRLTTNDARDPSAPVTVSMLPIVGCVDELFGDNTMQTITNRPIHCFARACGGPTVIALLTLIAGCWSGLV